VDLISLKFGQYRANLIARIEFVSSISYTFLPNTDFQFLFTRIFEATCHSTPGLIIAQKIKDTTNVKPQ